MKKNGPMSSKFCTSCLEKIDVVFPMAHAQSRLTFGQLFQGDDLRSFKELQQIFKKFLTSES